MLQNHPPLVSRNSSGFYPYTVDNSLRFNDDDTAYLSRTQTTTTNSVKCTLSVWVKRGALGVEKNVFSGYTGSDADTRLYFNTDDTLRFYSRITDTNGASAEWFGTSTAVYRDTSAWYHVVVSIDTSSLQATNNDYYTVYVNGVDQVFSTVGGASLVSVATVQNRNTCWNVSGYSGNIGAHRTSTTYDGYFSEFKFIDGQALTPSSFGTDKNGVWVPKPVSGLTFGNNGFYLDFKDGTSATTLGYDVSGNANHYTASGIATNDQMTDTPTNNYCTGNPISLHNRTAGASDGYFENGNLDWVVGGGVRDNIMCSQLLPQSGKCYFEVRYQDGANLMDGSLQVRNADHPWSDTTSHCGIYLASGANDNTYGTVNGTSNSTSHAGTWHDTRLVCGLAVDIDTGEFWIHQAGSWLDSNGAVDATANPSTGVNPTGTITASNRSNLVPMVSGYSNSGTHANVLNFGQNGTFSGAETAGGNSDANGQGDFFYAVPTDFLALCTANLPEPTLSPNSAENVTDYFDVVLYEGTGAELAITDLSFSPSMVVIKNRDAADQWMIFDTVRGATKYLSWDDLDLEVTDTQTLKTFDSLGFTLGTNVAVNTSSESYVAYCFKEHTDFFDMFGYTGTGALKTEAHSLNVPPEFFYVKDRDTALQWITYCESLPVTDPETDFLLLDTNDAVADATTNWNDTAPTSSVITVNTAARVNASTDAFVSHLWASLEGMCKVGYYKGNGSADGPFAYCGFRPAFVMIKRTDVVQSWTILDSTRNAYNYANSIVWADLIDAEASGGTTTSIDFLSNGFKARGLGGSINTASGDYIFLAFAEMPFKYSNAR